MNTCFTWVGVQFALAETLLVKFSRSDRRKKKRNNSDRVIATGYVMHYWAQFNIPIPFYMLVLWRGVHKSPLAHGAQPSHATLPLVYTPDLFAFAFFAGACVDKGFELLILMSFGLLINTCSHKSEVKPGKNGRFLYVSRICSLRIWVEPSCPWISPLINSARMVLPKLSLARGPIRLRRKTCNGSERIRKACFLQSLAHWINNSLLFCFAVRLSQSQFAWVLAKSMQYVWLIKNIDSNQCSMG